MILVCNISKTVGKTSREVLFSSNMMFRSLSLLLFISSIIYSKSQEASKVPLVVTTWNLPGASDEAWKTITDETKSALDGLEDGISWCEENQCNGAVGWGGKPDEDGETTLDAMIMDGVTHDVGAVGCLRRIKPAISVARKVLEHTKHSFLVGDLATNFAKKFGFKEETLVSKASLDEYLKWKLSKCQPNFWKNVHPDPEKHCAPYDLWKQSKLMSCPSQSSPVTKEELNSNSVEGASPEDDHDTISMIIIDKKGHMAVGSSTNGLNHKIPGRVGDSPIPGSGAYVDSLYGGAAATGDGDVMMRFVPSYHAVEMMKNGMTPVEAAQDAMRRIQSKYPVAQAAIITANIHGDYGASCTGYEKFPFIVVNPIIGNSTLNHVDCVKD